MRKDGRANDQLRQIEVKRNFTTTPAGSVLWQQGGTIVLCTASITSETPPWFKEDRAGGWLTCDYVMLPGSTPQRKDWPKIGHTDSRGTEIQRIIGRSLRAAIDLSKIGPHTIHVDCQVLQADGGTRTASICGGWLAMADALKKLPKEMPGARAGYDNTRFNMGDSTVSDVVVPARYDAKFYDPTKALVNTIAAVSVGVVDGEVRLDLDYSDDARADVDMNIACTDKGAFVEVQGSAESGGGFDASKLQQMIDLAVKGCREIAQLQNKLRSM
jgi:ribonuclease PH